MILPYGEMNSCQFIRGSILQVTYYETAYPTVQIWCSKKENQFLRFHGQWGYSEYEHRTKICMYTYSTSILRCRSDSSLFQSLKYHRGRWMLNLRIGSEDRSIEHVGWILREYVSTGAHTIYHTCMKFDIGLKTLMAEPNDRPPAESRSVMHRAPMYRSLSWRVCLCRWNPKQ